MANHQKASNQQIIEFINQTGATTQHQVEKHFNYHINALRNRLLQLVINKKIHSIIFPSCGKQASKIFLQYQGNRVYYTSKQGLSSWVEHQIPSTIPQSLRKSINQSIGFLDIYIEEK